VWTELGIGIGWLAAAYGLFRFFQLEGRRRAALETF